MYNDILFILPAVHINVWSWLSNTYFLHLETTEYDNEIVSFQMLKHFRLTWDNRHQIMLTN